MTDMYAEVVPLPDGTSLADDVVRLRAVFHDDPELFASLQTRGEPGHEVSGRWDSWAFADDDGEPRSGRLELKLNISDVWVLLRIDVEPDEPSEPVEALTHAKTFLIDFEHHRTGAGQGDQSTPVTVPAPPDPDGVLTSMLAWRRSLPQPPPRSSAPEPERSPEDSLWQRLRTRLGLA